MNRRGLLAGLATGGIALSAGCIDDILDDLTTYSASPVEVSAEAQSEAGYEHEETQEVQETEEFAGEEVEVTNYISQYHRTIDVPIIGEHEAGVFAAISTPQVSIAGEEFNPVGDMDASELAALVQDQYEELSIGDEVGNRTVNTLETEVDVSTFEGEATLSGTEFDVLIDVGRFEHGDDHIVVVGVYPEELSEEEEGVTTMIEGLEHEE